MTPGALPVRRAAPVVGGALLAALAATSAGAATPPVIERSLQPATEETALVASIGNGLTAWSTQDTAPGPGNAPVVVWTPGPTGAPRRLATLTGTRTNGAGALEVGTAEDGVPIAAIQTVDARTDDDELRLVRLDTGAVTRIRSRFHGRTVGGVGIDRGRLYFTTHPAAPTSRRRSVLWRAPLTGTRIGPATRIRTSAPRETWLRVLADGDRVAVEATTPVSDGTGVYAHQRWRFGTPRGPWRRTTFQIASDLSYAPIHAVGIDRDRLVTVNDRGAGQLVTRLPLAKGGATVHRTVGPESGDYTGLVPASLPGTGRLLTRDPDATGATAIGYTADLFP